jgi:broad specificity phosphatase PhoE
MKARSNRILCGLAWGFAIAAGPWAARASAQEVVFVVRHAERLDDSSDSPLSADGKARATRLAEHLRNARITAIFATQFVRTADTAKPLADRLGLQLQRVPAAQTTVLLARLRALGPKARVLVVGHSDTVPTILTQLGSKDAVTIAPDEYDNLFVVLPGAGDASPVAPRGKAGSLVTPRRGAGSPLLRLRY